MQNFKLKISSKCIYTSHINIPASSFPHFFTIAIAIGEMDGYG